MPEIDTTRVREHVHDLAQGSGPCVEGEYALDLCDEVDLLRAALERSRELHTRLLAHLRAGGQ